MKKNKISSFKIAGAFIGTIIGAGFATGQEVLQFFVKFKQNGMVGIIIASFLFILFGNIIIQLGQKLNSKSHIEVVEYGAGKYLGGIIDYIITFFLFGALTVMFAGSGALVVQQFGISSFWGSLVMAIITGLTVVAGLNGVVNSISFLVPFLVVATVGISIWALFVSPNPQNATLTALSVNELTQNWLVSAILYVSYNILLAVAVLAPIGASVSDKKTIRNGAIIGGAVLGLGAISIYLALVKYVDTIVNTEVPMAYISSLVSPLVQIVYIIALMIAIYTTAVGSLFGFVSRVQSIKKVNVRILILVVSLLALAGSQFGFSLLVKYLYSIVGYAGLFFLGSLLYAQFRPAKKI